MPAARLEIPTAVLAVVAAHAERSYPEECCGVLIGRALPEGGGAAVVRAVAASNERVEEQQGERGRRYVIGAEAVLRTDRAARAEGLGIVGYYHSHPDHPAVPSAFDREHAWAGVSYLIVPVEDGKAGSARSWRLAGGGGADGEFFEETLVTADDPASGSGP